MRITWLGQAGLLFNKNGFQIMIDPYLSDSIGSLNPNKHRSFPVDENIFQVTELSTRQTPPVIPAFRRSSFLSEENESFFQKPFLHKKTEETFVSSVG